MKKKTVYVNEWQGKDTNDGLSETTPVLTRKRADQIARKEVTQEIKIVGTPDIINYCALFDFIKERIDSEIAPSGILA
jgi:hypothetical protein